MNYYGLHSMWTEISETIVLKKATDTPFVSEEISNISRQHQKM